MVDPPRSPPGSEAEADLLLHAIQELSLARGLPAIQAVVRRAARELCGADGASFILRDGDQCYYADEDAISPLWKGQRFPMEACVSGWVMQHQTSASIPDIDQDPRVPSDIYAPTFVRSLVVVPIRVENPLGAIGVYWASAREATPRERRNLEALANATATAIESHETWNHLEERVAERTAQLEQANLALEHFASVASHDLRSPLASVYGLLVTLRQRSTGRVPRLV